MLYIPVGHLGYVHETVLMHAYIHKSAEIHNISYCPLEFHPGRQVGNVQHIASEHRCLHIFSRISSRFLQLCCYILESVFSDTEFFGDVLPCGKASDFSFGYIPDIISAFIQYRSGGIIAFRVHGSRVERLASVRYPHKTRTLLECFRSELRDFEELPSVGELPVFIPVCHYIRGNLPADTGYIAEK